VRALTTSILTEFGYIVIEAKDGIEAVARFVEQPDQIQLCLFDMIMPKKNGNEAYEEIRKMRPDLRVLFMSGYQSDISRQGELSRDGKNLITKPVMPQNLLKRVREVLDR
jgi:CheY-like chemotaxis protein